MFAFFRSAMTAIVPVTLLFTGFSPEALAQQQLTFTAGKAPETQIAPNAAYGTVRFRLEVLKNGRPTNDSLFRALLDGLQGVMKRDGTYTVTVELLAGDSDEVLARRALVTAERKSQGWFIFNRQTVEKQAVEWYGDFPVSQLVAPGNNNLRIRVRSYFSETAKFDMETFNLLAGFVAKAKLLGAANTVIDTAWKPIAQQIEGLLTSSQTEDISDTATLSFAKLDGNVHPASGVFIRDYRLQPNDDGASVRYTIRLVLETRTSEGRVANFKDGKVIGLINWQDVLAAARVADQPIDLLLSNSKTEAVKKFFADLNSTAGYKADDIGERCDRTYDELARHFTVTDKVVSYWALLHLYRRKLATNALAKDCVGTGIRAQMTAIGLSLGDLPFTRDVTVAAAPPTANIALESAPNVARSVEKIVPSNSVVGSLLGEKDTSKTFQVFPIRRLAE